MNYRGALSTMAASEVLSLSPEPRSRGSGIGSLGKKGAKSLADRIEAEFVRIDLCGRKKQYLSNFILRAERLEIGHGADKHQIERVVGHAAIVVTVGEGGQVVRRRYLQAGLLLHFAGNRCLRRLQRVHEAARQVEFALRGLSFAPGEQHPTLRVADQSDDGGGGVLEILKAAGPANKQLDRRRLAVGRAATRAVSENG